MNKSARRDTYTCEYGDYHLTHTDDKVHPTEFLFFHNVILYFIILYFNIGITVPVPLGKTPKG